ncbi:hypothetical protein CBR_g41083 [Chara braunii]|uniref:Uncharacterized protein n=1 Tax=Chara braunii TaxID=69332 RepID=A0A388LVA5_CHABU|nr:hypothetical protein CBR_g41083 [Chara braunii]|eukprot:GBG86179.1 hypothetical protein CBR_g41083 [Chara braunii]
METQDMVKGIAGVSNEGISAGANTADCAVALAGICAQAADLSTDGDTSDDGAECLVPYENVERTRAGGHFPYDVNWVSGRLQPGTVGGTPCFAFKVNGEWVPYPAPTEASWRCVTLSIIFDRVLRLNDAATPDEKSRHVLKLWRVLDAKGDLRLNDFEYDSVDCGESWVIGGLDTAAGSVCAETDARRDPRWGWVPHDAPLLCGRVRMPMRDAMGNVWTVCYINGSFVSRPLNREVTEEEKMMMACPTAVAHCFSPPLRNPVELEVAEGKVFAGEQGYTYTYARGEEATADGLSPLVWNPPNLKPDVLAAMDITAHEMDSGPLVCDCGRPFMSLRTLNSHRARACPAVVEEGAQRQENNAAHDPGPSDMGAANLAADDSDDEGAEDNANGAAGDNAEPEAQPVETFDSSRRLAALILSARGGVGMSHCDVDALLSLLKDPRFSAADIAYCNSRECFAWAGSLAEAAGWKESDPRSDDWPEGAHAILWHRDWRTAFLSIMQVASLKPAGKKDKCRKKSGAEKRESKEHRRSGAGLSAKMVQRRRRKSSSKVTVPSSERDISTLKERNESPPSTPVEGKRGRGAENRPPRAPEKKSRDDRTATTHRSSKKRISYKDERPMETIDLGGSDDRHSTPQAEEEEEHDRSTPEKSDGAEDEEGGNEGDDSGPSRGQSQDTDEDDNNDSKSASQSTGEDRSAASEGDDSPSPSRTLRSEGERQARNGSDTEEPVGDRQIVQHVSATRKEDTFFAAVQATAKLAGGTAEIGLRSHIAERGIRAVIGECNRIMTTIRGEITWQLKHWF